MKIEIGMVALGALLIYVAYRVHQAGTAAPALIKVDQRGYASVLDWWA